MGFRTRPKALSWVRSRGRAWLVQGGIREYDRVRRAARRSDAGRLPTGPPHRRAPTSRRRSRLRGFVFPVTAGFLAWYLLYVLLASFATDFMATPVLGNINLGADPRAAAVRVDLRDHRGLHPLRRPRARPTVVEAPRRDRGDPMSTTVLAATADSNPALNISIFLAFVVVTLGIVFYVNTGTRRRPRPTSTPRAAASPAPRTGSRSPVTTCRRRRSWGSRVPSRSTATTASSTRSGSWSRGWSRCCWWRS